MDYLNPAWCIHRWPEIYRKVLRNGQWIYVMDYLTCSPQEYDKYFWMDANEVETYLKRSA